MDIAALNVNGWPDLIVSGSFYSSLLTEEVRGNATLNNVPIIELVDAYGSNVEDAVLPASMVALRWTFLVIPLRLPGLMWR